MLLAFGVKFTNAPSAHSRLTPLRRRMRMAQPSEMLIPYIAPELPDNPERPQMVLAAQIEGFFDNLGRYLIGRVLWNVFSVDQLGFALLFKVLPSLVIGPILLTAYQQYARCPMKP